MYYVLIYQGYDYTNDGYYSHKKFKDKKQALEYIKSRKNKIWKKYVANQGKYDWIDWIYMKSSKKNISNKNARGSAAQFFVAGELCRRDLVAVVTMGNTPNTDVLCSNVEGTKFVHIQVKTFPPGNRKVTVGMKAEKRFW